MTDMVKVRGRLEDDASFGERGAYHMVSVRTEDLRALLASEAAKAAEIEGWKETAQALTALKGDERG